MLRFLLVEAAQVTVRSLPEWRSTSEHAPVCASRACSPILLTPFSMLPDFCSAVEMRHAHVWSIPKKHLSDCHQRQVRPRLK